MGTRDNHDAAGMQRREFDTIRFARHPLCRPARLEELPRAAEFVAERMPGLPLDDLARFSRLAHFDSDTIQLFLRNERIVGVYCMLFLRHSGLRMLLSGGLNLHSPPLELLAGREESPFAVYKWLVLCPGAAATGIAAISELLSQQRYARADLYARPETQDGLRIMVNVGFRKMPSSQKGLYRYIRIRNRANAQRVAA